MTTESSFLAASIEANRLAAAEADFNNRLRFAAEFQPPFEVVNRLEFFEVSLTPPAFFSLDYKTKPVVNAYHVAADRWHVLALPGATRSQICDALAEMVIPF